MQFEADFENLTGVPMNLVNANVAVGTWASPPPQTTDKLVIPVVVECSADNKAELSVEYSGGIYQFGFTVSFWYDPEQNPPAGVGIEVSTLMNSTFIDNERGGWLLPPGTDGPVSGWRYGKIIAVNAK